MTIPRPRSARGFTLIELVITVVVVAILAGIALPNFRDFMQRNAVATQSNAVLAELQYARNDAITRRVLTHMCGSSDGASCSGANLFEDGWVVYRETAPGPAATFDTDDEVLRVTQAQQGTSIRLVDSDGAPVDEVGFSQDGSVLGGKGLSFLICPLPKGATVGESTDRVQGSELLLSASGRPSTRPIPAGETCGS